MTSARRKDPKPGDDSGIDVVYLLADTSLTLDNAPVLQSQVLDWLKVQAANGVRARHVSRCP